MTERQHVYDGGAVTLLEVEVEPKVVPTSASCVTSHGKRSGDVVRVLSEVGGTVRIVGDLAIRWLRLRRSGLLHAFDDPEEACNRHFGVQAQMLTSAGLALSARLSDFTKEDLLAALWRERSLVKIWGQRGTLHLYSTRDWPEVYSALRGRKTWWERRIERDGGDVVAYHSKVQRLADYLATVDSLGRQGLRDLDVSFEEWELSSWGGIFGDLVARGFACHSVPVDGEKRFSHREVWVPNLQWDTPDHMTARGTMLRQYLTAYGPATKKDFAYWSGTSIRRSEPCFDALAEELEVVRFRGKDYYLPAGHGGDLDKPPARGKWPVRLLHRFDPLLLAHANKEIWVDKKHYKKVWKAGGHIEPVVLVHGRIAGTWKYEIGDDELVVEAKLWEKLLKVEPKKIRQEAQRVATFFGVERSKVKLQAPR